MFRLNNNVQVSEFDEGCDVKCCVNGPSMTSDMPTAKSEKRISS